MSKPQQAAAAVEIAEQEIGAYPLQDEEQGDGDEEDGLAHFVPAEQHGQQAAKGAAQQAGGEQDRLGDAAAAGQRLQFVDGEEQEGDAAADIEDNSNFHGDDEVWGEGRVFCRPAA